MIPFDEIKIDLNKLFILCSSIKYSAGVWNEYEFNVNLVRIQKGLRLGKKRIAGRSIDDSFYFVTEMIIIIVSLSDRIHLWKDFILKWTTFDWYSWETWDTEEKGKKTDSKSEIYRSIKKAIVFEPAAWISRILFENCEYVTIWSDAKENISSKQIAWLYRMYISLKSLYSFTITTHTH